MELYIKGHVEAIYFQNDANYYKVVLVSVEDTNSDYSGDTIVVTGTMGQIHEGSDYIFYGQLVEHARYGLQMQISRYEQQALLSKDGLIRYLSSDKFYGIGEVLATRIVDTLGEQTIDKIIDKHSDLNTIQGLTAAKKEVLIEGVTKDQSENKSILELMQLGFSDKESYKIFQYYKEKASLVIKENPYSVIETIEGMSFSKIDSIAEQLHIEANDDRRFQGGLYHALKELSFRQGDTYFDASTLLNVTIKLLEKSRHVLIDETELAKTLLTLTQVGVIIEDNNRLSLPSLYYAEEGIAKGVHFLLQQETKPISNQDIDDVIAVVEKQLHITYSSQQKQAIKKTITSPLSILTGGPGTGKTTVLKGIVYVFSLLYDFKIEYINEHQSPILLAAPTGRAAKRMKELIGLPASTLHRLLGIGITGNDIVQDTIHPNELDGILLIIDEMSMVDTWLMNWVFRAIKRGIHVLLVGDTYQLPSVSPGQVLQDLLLSQQIPYTQLETIYRQSENSTIVQLAHHIKEGVLPADFTQQQKDRLFIPATQSQLPIVIRQLFDRAIQKGYSINDVQILAPMYKGNAGITALNDVIQSLVNPPQPKKREVVIFDKVFRVNDKVLQQVNVPEKNVFNGDVGEIVAILRADETSDNEEEVIVLFDDNEVHYKKNEYNQLTLAYCCSVHKAQGSEFSVVIIPMIHQYYRMLRRDLLYTALTRSKQSVMFCGELSAFQTATQTIVSKRKTLLAEKIIKVCQPDSTVISDEAYGLTDSFDERTNIQPKAMRVLETTLPLHDVNDNTTQNNFILSEDIIDDIDAMIGMEGITPYLFEKNVRI